MTKKEYRISKTNPATDIPTCAAVHPRTGDPCTLLAEHKADEDVRVRQHAAANGVRWPHLSQLDPAEGFNGPSPARL